MSKTAGIVESNEVSYEGDVSSADNLSYREPYVDEGPKTWKGQVWDSFDKPKEERWFLFKLDCTLLFIGCAGVFLRYLDQTNINNAFVSGMKEEMSLFGNELNYANTAWTVGYIVGQIPSNIIITRVKPHIWLPFLEISWSIMTFATSAVSNTSGLYAVRFFLGFFESGHFPGIMYITSSWYTKRELSKRMSIIQFCTGVGPMFSGYLQAAAYTGLNGVDGRSGWRWLFIIDGIISLPLAIATIFLLPDFPRNQKPNIFFTQKEIDLARWRTPQESSMVLTYRVKDIRYWFNTWHIYGFALMFSFMCIIGGASASFPFWFKSYNTPTETVFTVPQINTYPTPMYAIQIVTTVIYAYLSDNKFKGKRHIIIIFVSVWMFSVLLALSLVPVHPEHKASRWALYYLLGFSGGAAGQAWTWVNEANLGEPIKRAFVSTIMNSVAYSFLAWTPIVMFPTKYQPYVTTGNIAACVLAACMGLTAIGLNYIQSKKIETGFWRSVPLKISEEEHLENQRNTNRVLDEEKSSTNSS